LTLNRASLVSEGGSSLPDSTAVGVFGQIAPYLKDPLILIGFILFLAFLFSRQLIRSGIIPQLNQTLGAKILKLLLQYGFVLALLVILLGFGLRYYELREEKRRLIERQAAAADLIGAEICADSGTMIELRKNVKTMKNATSAVSSVLRDDRFAITSTLFGTAPLTLDAPSPGSATAAFERFEKLKASKLLDDPRHVERHQRLCAAIRKTVGRTKSTLESLADRAGTRYRVTTTSWDAHQGTLTTLAQVDRKMTASLYETMKNARNNYDRLVGASLEYVESADEFCAGPPTEGSTARALAAEQLLTGIIESFSKGVTELTGSVERSLQTVNKTCAGRPVSDLL
jgi:hypothetical protein